MGDLTYLTSPYPLVLRIKMDSFQKLNSFFNFKICHEYYFLFEIMLFFHFDFVSIFNFRVYFQNYFDF
jgi:hypothetical protein